jgi:ParB-like chromosome segregation protein Spo0J
MKTIELHRLEQNPNNPRKLKREQLEKLKRSIAEFPAMLQKRPLVAVSNGKGGYTVIGGNMRLQAARALGFTELPVIIADDFSKDEQARFVIADNVNYGGWDWDALANEWELDDLQNWGMEIPGLEEIEPAGFEDEPETGEKKIILEYTERDYILVRDALQLHGKTPEAAVFNLLGLNSEIRA